MAWPFRHIRWKIVLPYAFLTVVLATAGSYVATHLVTGSLSERFDNQLAEAGRVVADAVVRKERDHLETVRAVAYTEGVPEAIRAADRAAVGMPLPTELTTPPVTNMYLVVPIYPLIGGLLSPIVMIQDGQTGVSSGHHARKGEKEEIS